MTFVLKLVRFELKMICFKPILLTFIVLSVAIMFSSAPPNPKILKLRGME